MKPVQIVTIKAKIPLYKKEDLASKVELVALEENGFEIVAQKDLYNIGDKAVYIQPDYCLSEIPIFSSFIAPDGNEDRSLLGKVGGKPRRIRAKSFNLSKVPNGDKLYSNGILLPLEEVVHYIMENVKDYSKKYDSVYAAVEDESNLGVYKYEEPEISTGGSMGNSPKTSFKTFPEGWYKTDETNIYNKWHCLTFPVYLLGTQKIDGSSISISADKICSRTREVSRFVKKVVGRRKKTWKEILLFRKPDLNIYEEVENENEFVKVGKQYQDALIEVGVTDIVLRGEANGKTFKGSGNVLNATAKEEPNIKFFSIDKIENGVTKRLPYEDFLLKSSVLRLPVVPLLFAEEFQSKEQLIERCESIFKENKNMEGIVIRDSDFNFSAKFMNNYYDSKK